MDAVFLFRQVRSYLIKNSHFYDTKTSAMPTLRLHSIKCNVPDEIDKDEMFLKFDGHKIWPEESKYFRMDADDRVVIDHDLEVAVGWVEIELWDYDFVSLNDHLGSFKLNIGEQGKFTASMVMNEKETHSASYFLEWEVL